MCALFTYRLWSRELIFKVAMSGDVVRGLDELN